MADDDENQPALAEIEEHRRCFGCVPPSAGPDARYPYLVIRWMAAVHGIAGIVVASHDDGLPALARGLKIVDPAYREGVALDLTIRRKVLQAAVERSVQSRFQMCVVFAADDAVYVYPNGRTVRHAQLPRGGMRIDDVEVCGE